MTLHVTGMIWARRTSDLDLATGRAWQARLARAVAGRQPARRAYAASEQRGIPIDAPLLAEFQQAIDRRFLGSTEGRTMDIGARASAPTPSPQRNPHP